MQVHVKFRPRRQDDRSIALPDDATVSTLIAAVGERVDMMLAVRGATPIAEDEALVDGEEILLLSAASGG